MLIQWAWELLAPLAAFIFIGTQVLIPALRGTPYFPAFKRYRVHTATLSAAEQVEQAEEQLRAARLRREAERIRSEIEGEEQGIAADRSRASGIRGVVFRKGEETDESNLKVR